MRKFYLSLAILMLFMFIGSAFAANLDDFNGPLAKMWTLRDPAKKATVNFSGGNLVMDLKAGADMYIKGTDAGVMILMEPPNMANFSVEMAMNPSVKGTEPPAFQPGLIFINEALWAYSIWGPYANTDIRLEDCVGASYRWRADIGVAVDVNKVAIDQDVWIMITKKGDQLEFFTKGNENDDWVSGGVDKKLAPNYTAGNFKVGLVAKSWGGSVDSSCEFEFFDIPEVPKAVSSQGKITSTWSAIKK